MSRDSLVERYRPKTLDDVVGHPVIIRKIQILIKKEKGLSSNLLFFGPPGTGKTTVARIISTMVEEQYGSSFPGSNFSSFHTYNGRNLTLADIRGEITRLTELRGKRVIFIDEADGLSESDQLALATIMEGTNGVFILSSNTKNLDKKTLSRCKQFNFKAIKAEDILLRLFEISKAEGIIKPNSPPLINRFYSKMSREAQGDLRAAILELDSYIVDGELDIELVKLYVDG